MVVYALKKAKTAQRQKILETLGNQNATPEQIKETIKLIDSLGAIRYAKNLAEKYINKAKKALSVFPDSDDKEDLLSLSDLIFDRQH
jgi:geranylgeranyl pyrophosphate synthase